MKTLRQYILDGHTPIRCPNPFEWAKWFEKTDRIVANTDIGDAFVSTVFLGLDHNFYPSGPPLLFETMVFKKDCTWKGLRGETHEYGQWDEIGMERYSSWEEAERGHEAMVKRVREKLGE